MVYRRRRRKKKYYGEYHSDARLQRYFSPIVDDLKSMFFALSSTQLSELLLDYQEKYGDSAYSYAQFAYPSWKSGRRKMSDQTLLRLVETLPYFITERQRLVLLEKMFAAYVEDYPKSYVSKTTTWSTYETDLNNLITEIKGRYSVYSRPIDFKQEILDMATWLCNDDMTVGKRILGNYYYKLYCLKADSACVDVERFRYLCRQLHARQEIYGSQQLTLYLPTITVDLSLFAENKPFLKRFKDFFS